MVMAKTDRRVQRTRELLQKALIQLINEHGYDAITIQDIADRANVGRTTFYKHYGSKDELFINCHKAMVNEFYGGLFYSLSHQELLSAEVPPGMTAAYQHLQEARVHLHPIFQSQESLRQIRIWNAQEIETNLRAGFAETDSAIPLDVLANYLAGAQIALVQWWLEKRRPYKAEDLAQSFHRLQRAAIRDAFGLRDDKKA